MNIENQVCSLELSKRLKELGLKQRSLFYWLRIETSKNVDGYGLIYITNIFQPVSEFKEIYSAFTVAELGEMLPIMVQSYKSFKEHWECVYDPLEIGFVEKTEANVRAKMLIHFLENKLIESNLL